MPDRVVDAVDQPCRESRYAAPLDRPSTDVTVVSSDVTSPCFATLHRRREVHAARASGDQAVLGM